MQDHPIIAFDESGHTGPDLLEKNQPVFVLASVKMNLKQASELKKMIDTKANELKFNKLKKYYKYHSQIVSILNSEIISEETVRLAVFHKEYCIWAYTVDRLIEPLAYRDGIDFYKNGLNLALSNLLFYCTPVLCDKAIYEQYKTDFLNLFQQRDTQSIDKFYATVQALISSSKTTDYGTTLSPILASREIIRKILKGWDTNNFDTTLTGFIDLVDYWGRKTDDMFYAYFDNSKPLTHFKHLVDKVKGIYIEQQEIGTDRRTLQLPLKLTDIKFVNSEDNDVVQIADVIAGAATHYYRAMANEEFRDELSNEIGDSRLIKLHHNLVWPHQAFTPEALKTVHTGGINLLDKLVSLYDK